MVDRGCKVVRLSLATASLLFFVGQRSGNSLKLKLKEIADIQAGYQFRGRVEENPTGTVRLIQVKDIDDEHQLRTEDLMTVEPHRDPEPYLVSEGDVLFLSRGHHMGATAITEPLVNTIATGYFYILRVKQKMALPEFLGWYLNHPAFQDKLKPCVQGSNTPMVSRADFEQITIEIPPLEIQQKIVALNELVEKERRLLTRLQEKRAALVHAITMKAVRAATKRKGKKQ